MLRGIMDLIQLLFATCKLFLNIRHGWNQLAGFNVSSKRLLFFE